MTPTRCANGSCPSTRTALYRIPGLPDPVLSSVIGVVGLCLQVQSPLGVRLVTRGQAADPAAFAALWERYNQTPLFWASDGKPLTP